jgi:hypothetical protein
MSSKPHVMCYADLKKCLELATIKERQKCKARHMQAYMIAINRTQWQTIERRDGSVNHFNTPMPRKDNS